MSRKSDWLSWISFILFAFLSIYFLAGCDASIIKKKFKKYKLNNKNIVYCKDLYSNERGLLVLKNCKNGKTYYNPTDVIYLEEK